MARLVVMAQPLVALAMGRPLLAIVVMIQLLIVPVVVVQLQMAFAVMAQPPIALRHVQTRLPW